MRRPIEWTEKTEEGKREIRVTLAPHSIKWQFKNPGAEMWDYDSPATEADWETLETKVKNLAQRGHVLDAEMAIVRSRGAVKGK